MKLVIKIGGAALDDRELVSTFARTIPSLCREGHKLVIVHGGGAALSRTLKQLGCETTFINGLRVTDSQTRDVAIMVLAGQLNKQLVAAIGEAGQPAIGICGGDLRMVLASRKKQPDLGYVGEVCTVDSRWIERLWEAGMVPVVSSLALGFDGEYYNVNADQMASACAIACGAHALIYLTDVPGVKDAGGSVIRWLDLAAITRMVQEATISGGMLPKLEACTSALKRGVSRVRILPAARAEVLPGFFTQPIDCGTEVIAS
ncbi:MAG TPA: acetylglutamate kinase [Candidatus Binatia bacterium]|nr:acetylglutamate kinase [Candidatus Binatia bacterium]